MNTLFPHMTDSPERSQTLGGLAYGVIPFVVLPFTLILMIIGVEDYGPYIFLEYLYQSVSLVALLVIFRSYLQDSWLNVTLREKDVLVTTLAAAGMICAIYILCILLTALDLIPQNLIVLGTMPMTGIELTLLPGDFIWLGGIPASLFLILAGPIITACLFYAPAFAPVCVSGKRFLAYAAAAAWLAVPRIIPSCTVWGGRKELELYLAQLPIHLIACWAYQKTNTLWTPIFALMLSNICTCALQYILTLTGFFS